MTAQNLYNNLKQGKINESQFLREIRHQSHLPITKFNSFKDTIQILKTRGIISEEMGKYKTDKNVFFPKQEIKTIDQVSPHEYSKGINYEMELFDKSVGQNMPTDEELEKAQQKVLRNLSKDEYYYTRKIMTNGQKKQEKQDLDYTELGKETKAKNQMIKGKILKENSDFADPEDEDEDCFSCNRNKSGLITDKMSQEDLAKLSHLIEEWGLTEQDLNDEDIIDELATQFMNDNSRMNENDLEEGIALKDKAGNISYVKDDREATDKMNDARQKGIQLTKQNV
jgi:DNA-binding transcriptional MocR family regulator